MGLNILLIDDSPVMRKMVARALRQADVGCESTEEAGNGQEGLDALGANPIDLVICDWNMPVMDGLEFVKEARKSSQVPILMLSTEGTQDKISAALDAGASGYLAKPFTPEKIGAKISEVMG